MIHQVPMSMFYPHDPLISHSRIPRPASRLAEVHKYWWIINPDSNRFSHLWQVVTNFALSFVALVTPLQVGLLEIRDLEISRLRAVVWEGFLGQL